MGSSILAKAIPFLLLPILTSYLSPEEYGKLSIFLIFISLYSALIGMALHTNIASNFFKVKKDELAVIVGNIFFILLFATIFYFILTLGISSFYEEFFTIPTSFFLIIPVLIFMEMINTFNTTILRNEQRAYMFGLFEVSSTAIVMGVTVFCLTILGFGWYSQIVGIFTGGVVFSFVGIFYMYGRGYIKMKFDKEKIKSILNISIPLVPHLLATMIMAVSDRLFIEDMVGIKDVGLYSVGYSFGMIVMLVTDAFMKAWTPWFFKKLANPTEKDIKEIVKYTYFYIVCIFVTAIVIALVAKFILPYFVDEKYYAASNFILWVALGYAIRGVYQIFFPYLVHVNKTKFLAVCTGTAAIVNLLLNYFLIKAFGSIGAAYATAGAFFISALMVFWYQQKYYKMPWFKFINK